MESIRPYLRQLDQLLLIAAAASPALEGLVSEAEALGSARPRTLRALGVPGVVAAWCRRQRAELLENGSPDQLAALAEMEGQLQRLAR